MFHEGTISELLMPYLTFHSLLDLFDLIP
jgi:hypothetical protein